MITGLQQHIAELTHALTGHSRLTDQVIVNRLSSGSKISPQLALDIYRNNTRGARVRALETIYPVCQTILGDETFRAIAGEFVTADAIGSYDLNRYGETFPRHLRGLIEAGRLPDEFGYLEDLAGLECKYHAAYYADADPAFDFERFEYRVHDGEPVYLRPSTTLRLLATAYPIFEIWQLNRAARDECASPGRCHSVKNINGKQYLLVYREYDSPVVVAIGRRRYRLLEAFAQGKSLQTVIESVDRNVDELLPGLIANKWIVGID